MDRIPASCCPECRRIVVPPTAYCPDHPVRMDPRSLAGHGHVVSFTTLYSPPEGFSSPLHIALVELMDGARFFCHGEETRWLKVGARVAVEAVGGIYYFSHLGLVDRARLFWRRAGARGEKAAAIANSLLKRLWRPGREGD